jgi:hypothetical protein
MSPRCDHREKLLCRSNKDGTDLAQDKGKEAPHLKHATRPVQRIIPLWFSRIFRKAETGLHRRNAESPTETSHASHIPAIRSVELPQRTTWSDFSYTPEPECLSYPRPLCIVYSRNVKMIVKARAAARLPSRWALQYSVLWIPLSSHIC